MDMVIINFDLRQKLGQPSNRNERAAAHPCRKGFEVNSTEKYTSQLSN